VGSQEVQDNDAGITAVRAVRFSVNAAKVEGGSKGQILVLQQISVKMEKIKMLTINDDNEMMNVRQ
jgi:hypothetical protein